MEHGWGVPRELALVLGSGLCRVSRLWGEAGLTGGLRLGRDQRPPVAGSKDLWMALGARPKAG